MAHPTGRGDPVGSRLVFVHGIGGPRDPERELGAWKAALAQGMRLSGHSATADRLLSDTSVECVFASYADLFTRRQEQGTEDLAVLADDEEAASVLSDLLIDWVEALSSEAEDPRERRLLEHARAEAATGTQQQGSLQVVRRALNVTTTLLALRPWGRTAQWITPKVMVGHLSQVARYLARGERDSSGRTLDCRIRDRVLAAVSDVPSVVVAHSLGTVVALEALHEITTPTPLFVTLGSPLPMRTVIWPRLAHQPPAVPPHVEKWLNFWDRDDILAVRPYLERDIRPNGSRVLPASLRIDSDGTWVHSAEKYLAQPAVAGRVAEALGRTPHVAPEVLPGTTPSAPAGSAG
ncbi:hypothetical protein [Streptomyces cyaneofuscatus]|uniref:hypothetical protein n=1 Tax=Streptomyces cyaneofuscatus TaxID=66883 RepID=UPI00379266FE